MNTAQNNPRSSQEKLSHEEVQKAGFDILCTFDDFAKKHNLRYWLMYGTLLGAARHQGFIPWDDDVDICMPDDDYLRLVEIAKENPTIMGENFRFMTWAIDKKSHLPYMKIYDNTYEIEQEDLINPEQFLPEGMFIDIFPFVGYRPEKRKQIIRKMYTPYAFIRSMIYRSEEKGHPVMEVLRPCIKLYGKMRGLDTFQRQNFEYIKNCTDRFDNSPQVISIITTGIIMDKEVFEDTAMLEYEGRTFPAPGKYHEALNVCYGDDWMEIPPPEKRWSHPLHVYKK